MDVLLTCLGELNDPKLLTLASLICLIGVYGSFSVARHAGRREGAQRVKWAALSLVTAGSTAWATHMVALLAFRPGMQSGFEPVMTALSLLLAIAGIGSGLVLTLARQSRRFRFAGGVVIGLGVTILHYVGQSAFVVRGHVYWDHALVASTVLIGLVLFGLATLASVERVRALRMAGAPLLLLAIGVVHVGGMAAMTLEFDPRVQLPAWTMSPNHLAPVVAAVSCALALIAIIGFRLSVAARAKLSYERRRLGELANLGLEGLAICEGNRIVTANDSLSRLTGIARDDLAEREIESLLPQLDLVSIPEREEVDAQLLTLSGATLPVRVLRQNVNLAGSLQTVIAFRDQSERLSAEERIRTLAYTDCLTGLANRTRFQEVLAATLAEWREGGRTFSLLMFDLDGFKDVNDAFGHAWGDEVLRVVGQRARELVDADHLLARLGGDEFGVIVGGTSDPLKASALGVALIEAIEKPIPVGGELVHISASVGLKPAQNRDATADDLLLAADLALYDAKKLGRARVRLFTPELRNAAKDRLSLVEDLREAWEGGNFELYLQPQVNLQDNRIVGAEALLRWNHPYLGVLSPAAFLAVLETSPMALPVGDWILASACRHAIAMRQAGSPDFRIGVNLFAAQLRTPDFVERAEEALRASGLPARALELEITENIALRNERTIANHLARLRRMDVAVAFDDFGTGYASLTLLKQMDITRLKIDRSFICDIETDRKNQGIVDAVVRMAQGCDLEVIAEGVETQAQADYLRPRLSEAQGYLFGKPMPVETFRETFLSVDAPARMGGAAPSQR